MTVDKTIFSLIMLLMFSNVFTVKALDYSMGEINLSPVEKKVQPASTKFIYKTNISSIKSEPELSINESDTDNLTDENVDGNISTTTEKMDSATNTNYDYSSSLNNSSNFDFFGISSWFWLIVFVLAILIILIMYIQSL